MRVAKCMLQFLEWLNVANCIDGFPSGQEINLSIVFSDESIVLVFLLFG
jgi:hypothetical protein